MKGKILVVDDNTAFLDSIMDVLEIEGFDVATAASGEDALILTKSDTFDVIIMDIKMPGMNGVESFIEMKKQNPHIKVIMATAYSMEDLIQQALDEGAYAVLQKPINMKKLFEKIDELNQHPNGGLIMIAEDDRALCENLHDILKKEGFDVVFAHDGEEALKKASEQSFNILLLDMKLPLLNGLEVYRGIKQMNPNVVAIIISAYAKDMFDLIEQALDENAHTFLRKPLDMDKLINILNEVQRL